MTSEDRTSEFFSVCQSLPPSASITSDHTSTNYNGQPPPPPPPSTGISMELQTFHKTATRISQQIYTTSTLLNELTSLIHSRSASLFVDDSTKINSLVLNIKTNVESLNAQLDDANEMIERNKRRSRNGKQAGLEASNLVGQLREEFVSTTQGFKEVLKVRSERMKEKNDRQSEVLGKNSGNSNFQAGTGGNGGDEENVSLLGNKPKVYQDNSQQQGDMNLNNAMGGGSMFLNGNNAIGGVSGGVPKMDGPRLDLTSALLSNQNNENNKNGMPGGESSMQLPRPYGIRQRNNTTEPNIPTYSGSISSNTTPSNPTSSLPVYSPLDLQQMESQSTQQQQLQLIPDQTYLRQRADAMTEVESNIVELGTIFNKLAVMVNEHQELVQRVEDNVEDASGNIGLSMESLADTLEGLKTNKALFFKIMGVLVVFAIMFITFFA